MGKWTFFLRIELGFYVPGGAWSGRVLALWGDLREEEVKRVKRQQVVEVLEVKVKVVEHQGGVQSVSEMWEGKRGEVPAGAGNRVQYGLRVKATAVYPVPEEQQVPVGRTKQTLKDLLGCEMSVGDVDKSGLQRMKALI